MIAMQYSFTLPAQATPREVKTDQDRRCAADAKLWWSEMDSNQRFLSPYCLPRSQRLPYHQNSATVILAQETGARSPCAAPNAEPFRIAERPASIRSPPLVANAEFSPQPRENRMAAHVGGDDIAHREQVRPAVVVDDALGIASRSRGVVERNGVQLVDRDRALIALVTLGEERFVFDGADPFARTVVFRVVVVDDERADLGELQRQRHHTGKLAVDEERLRLAGVTATPKRGVRKAQAE